MITFIEMKAKVFVESWLVELDIDRQNKKCYYKISLL